MSNTGLTKRYSTRKPRGKASARFRFPRSASLITLVVLLAVCVYPLTSQAVVVGNTTQTFQVGVAAPDNMYNSAGAIGTLSVSAGTLPSGLIFNHVVGNLWRFEGTAEPGTVLDYPITLKDSGDNNTMVVTISIVKGPQTIVQPDIVKLTTDSGFQLTPHSTNGDGYRILADQPTYTYTGGNPAVATIDPSGNVAIVGPGSTTFTINSPENSSFKAAAPKTVNITVNAPLPSDKAITDFVINGVRGVITGSDITVTLPYGTDVTSLTPVVTHTGAYYFPAGAQDFSGLVEYTVTAVNATAQVYTVKVVLGTNPNPPRPPSSGSSEPISPANPTYEQAKIGRCREWVNVRSGPGTNYDIIGKAYLGETVELLQWNKDETWCKVIYNGGNNLGWVHGRFIVPLK